MDGSLLKGNKAQDGAGGAIANGGNAWITNSSFENNETNGDGGAIESASPITIINSTFTHNHAAGYGGAIRIGGAYGKLMYTEIISNTAEIGGGGLNNNGNLWLLNSFLSDNYASSFGGAIFAQGGSTGITDTVLSSNKAGVSGGAINNPGSNLMSTARQSASIRLLHSEVGSPQISLRCCAMSRSARTR